MSTIMHGCIRISPPWRVIGWLVFSGDGAAYIRHPRRDLWHSRDRENHTQSVLADHRDLELPATMCSEEAEIRVIGARNPFRVHAKAGVRGHRGGDPRIEAPHRRVRSDRAFR